MPEELFRMQIRGDFCWHSASESRKGEGFGNTGFEGRRPLRWSQRPDLVIFSKPLRKELKIQILKVGKLSLKGSELMSEAPLWRGSHWELGFQLVFVRGVWSPLARCSRLRQRAPVSWAAGGKVWMWVWERPQCKWHGRGALWRWCLPADLTWELQEGRTQKTWRGISHSQSRRVAAPKGFGGKR